MARNSSDSFEFNSNPSLSTWWLTIKDIGQKTLSLLLGTATEKTVERVKLYFE